MMYHITIVLLHYKAYLQLEKSLERLQEIEIPKNTKIQVVVVDNDSNKESLSKIEKRFPPTIFLSQRENVGVPAGFNYGYRYAYNNGADFIMMLSPDLLMEKDVISKLLDAMIQDPQIGIASTKMLLRTRPPRIFFVAGVLDKRRKSAKHVGLNEIDKGQYDNVVETEFVNCPLLIRREVFKKVGYFRPEFFMYYEDIDWHLRIRRAGFKLVCVKDAISWNMQPDKRDKVYPIKEYYNARNLLYFVTWNFSIKTRVVAYMYTFKEAIALFVNILENKESEKAYCKLLGMYDFLRGKKGKRVGISS